MIKTNKFIKFSKQIKLTITAAHEGKNFTEILSFFLSLRKKFQHYRTDILAAFSELQLAFFNSRGSEEKQRKAQRLYNSDDTKK